AAVEVVPEPLLLALREYLGEDLDRVGVRGRQLRGGRRLLVHGLAGDSRASASPASVGFLRHGAPPPSLLPRCRRGTALPPCGDAPAHLPATAQPADSSARARAGRDVARAQPPTGRPDRCRRGFPR